MAVVRESPVIAPPSALREIARRHLRFGWWALLVFLSLGAVLEGMHGFKVGWYLDVSNETRRMLFTLGHAHGVLLAVLNVVFGLTVMIAGANESAPWRIASPCLMAAAVMLPGGFLLGGIVIYDGDPGPAILIVPLGALLLFVAVLLTARSVGPQMLARFARGTGSSIFPADQ